MKKGKYQTDDRGQLHRQTQKRLVDERQINDLPQSREELMRLVEELQVHQIELAQQNEELQSANLEVEAERAKYADLYDFAPVGFFTLDKTGAIVSTNLTGATLLGGPRSGLINQPFAGFVSIDERTSFNLFLEKAFNSKTKSVCELRLLKENHSHFFARIEAVAENEIGCRLAVVDITECKLAEEKLVKISRELGERLKELNCLYAISNLATDEKLSLEQIFKQAVNLIPPAMQYPEVSCARIVLDGPVFETDNFQNTKWKLSSDILIHSQKQGEVEVCYLESRPQSDDGPFLNEEKKLVAVIASRLSRIVERLWSQAALAESELRFRALFQQAAVGVAQIETATGRFMHINQKYCDLVGYTIEEMKNLTFQDITYPDDLGPDLHNMELLVAGQVSEFSMEKRYFKKDGCLVWVNLTVSPIWAKGECPNYHIAVVQDITDRKRAEKALLEAYDNLEELVGQRTKELQETIEKLSDEIIERKEAEMALYDSEQRYRELVEGTDNLVVRMNSEGILLFVNHIAHKILGFSASECLGRSFFEFVFPEDMERTRKAFASWILKRAPKLLFENRLVTRSGQISDMLWSTSIHTDTQGNIQYINSIGANISQRKLIEREIINSKERYRTLIQSIPVGVMSLDNNYSITEWNQMAQIITGLTEEECLGRPCYELLGCDTFSDECPLKDALKTRKTVGPLERNIKNRAGTLIPVRCMYASLLNGNNQVIGGIVTFQDISELKNLENERYKLIAMLAHDMKSPLVAIQGFTKRLIDKSQEYELDKTLNYLDIIFKEAGKLEGLIKDFLEFSRLRSGNFTLDCKPTKLNLQLLEIIDSYMPRLTEIGIAVDIKFDEKLPMLNLDHSRIRRVFTNLLENALKHSPPNTTITIKAWVTNRSVLINITDQGSGISAEDIPFIFEPFYKGQLKKKSEGYGLGLAGVKAIIQAHGGKVYVFSKLGFGSSFTISLPRSVIITDHSQIIVEP